MYGVCLFLCLSVAFVSTVHAFHVFTSTTATFSSTQNGVPSPTPAENANLQKALHPRVDMSYPASIGSMMQAAEAAVGFQVATAYTVAHIDIPTVCPLWNNSCTGDHTEALLTFFNHTIVDLLSDDCFIDGGHGGGVGGGLFEPSCTSSLVPASSSSIRSRVMSYMRQPACTTAGKQAAAMYSYLSNYEACCIPCEVAGSNVDVYYWPSPDADTSCLKTIGDSVRPPLEGATTSCPPGALYTGTGTSYCNTYWG